MSSSSSAALVDEDLWSQDKITFPDNVSLNPTLSAPPTERRLFWSALTAHSLGIFGSKLAVAPMDRLQLLCQVKQEIPGFIQWFRSGSHWKGVGSHIAFSAVGQSSRFWIFSSFGIDREKHGNIFFFNVLAASSALFLAYPWEVRYVRNVSGVVNPFSLFNAYRGVSYALMSVPLHLGASLGALSFFRWVSDYKFPCDPVAIGACAGLVGGLAAYPVNTVRRQMICGHAISGSIFRRANYKGVNIYLLKSIPEYFLFSSIFSQVLGHSYL